MITAFGKELRKIRIDSNEVLKDMAQKLGVSSSFLSSVEVGRKNVPNGWCEKIASEYNLSNEQLTSLQKLAEQSINAVKLNLQQVNEAQRNVALVFARDFGSISDETAEKIINLVNHSGGKAGG